jgi:hypothetical protein
MYHPLLAMLVVLLLFLFAQGEVVAKSAAACTSPHVISAKLNFNEARDFDSGIYSNETFSCKNATQRTTQVYQFTPSERMTLVFSTCRMGARNSPSSVLEIREATKTPKTTKLCNQGRTILCESSNICVSATISLKKKQTYFILVQSVVVEEEYEARMMPHLRIGSPKAAFCKEKTIDGSSFDFTTRKQFRNVNSKLPFRTACYSTLQKYPVANLELAAQTFRFLPKTTERLVFTTCPQTNPDVYVLSGIEAYMGKSGHDSKCSNANDLLFVGCSFQGSPSHEYENSHNGPDGGPRCGFLEIQVFKDVPVFLFVLQPLYFGDDDYLDMLSIYKPGVTPQVQCYRIDDSLNFSKPHRFMNQPFSNEPLLFSDCTFMYMQYRRAQAYAFTPRISGQYRLSTNCKKDSQGSVIQIREGLSCSKNEFKSCDYLYLEETDCFLVAVFKANWQYYIWVTTPDGEPLVPTTLSIVLAKQDSPTVSMKAQSSSGVPTRQPTTLPICGQAFKIPANLDFTKPQNFLSPYTQTPFEIRCGYGSLMYSNRVMLYSFVPKNTREYRFKSCKENRYDNRLWLEVRQGNDCVDAVQINCVEGGRETACVTFVAILVAGQQYFIYIAQYFSLYAANLTLQSYVQSASPTSAPRSITPSFSPTPEIKPQPTHDTIWNCSLGNVMAINASAASLAKEHVYFNMKTERHPFMVQVFSMIPETTGNYTFEACYAGKREAARWYYTPRLVISQSPSCERSKATFDNRLEYEWLQPNTQGQQLCTKTTVVMIARKQYWVFVERTSYVSEEYEQQQQGLMPRVMYLVVEMLRHCRPQQIQLNRAFASAELSKEFFRFPCIRDSYFYTGNGHMLAAQMYLFVPQITQYYRVTASSNYTNVALQVNLHIDRTEIFCSHSVALACDASTFDEYEEKSAVLDVFLVAGSKYFILVATPDAQVAGSSMITTRIIDVVNNVTSSPTMTPSSLLPVSLNKPFIISKTLDFTAPQYFSAVYTDAPILITCWSKYSRVQYYQFSPAKSARFRLNACRTRSGMGATIQVTQGKTCSINQANKTANCIGCVQSDAGFEICTSLDLNLVPSMTYCISVVSLYPDFYGMDFLEVVPLSLQLLRPQQPAVPSSNMTVASCPDEKYTCHLQAINVTKLGSHVLFQQIPWCSSLFCFQETYNANDYASSSVYSFRPETSGLYSMSVFPTFINCHDETSHFAVWQNPQPMNLEMNLIAVRHGFARPVLETTKSTSLSTTTMELYLFAGSQYIFAVDRACIHIGYIWQDAVVSWELKFVRQ